jgi:hypothetical protein
VIDAAAASIIAATVLAGCFLEFAQYYLKGKRSRNPSYLLAATGLFLLFISLMGNDPLRDILLALTQPAVRFASFLAGCLFLLSSLALFLYITFVRPYRLRFEDAIMGDLPSGPPPEEE